MAFYTLISKSWLFSDVLLVRNSHPEVFCKKDVLRNFAKFTGRQLCESRFFNKIAGVVPETLSQVFSCEFIEISKTTFFTEHYRVTTSDCY